MAELTTSAGTEDHRLAERQKVQAEEVARPVSDDAKKVAATVADTSKQMASTVARSAAEFTAAVRATRLLWMLVMRSISRIRRGDARGHGSRCR